MKRLSDTEAQVLSAIGVRGDASLHELAQATKLPTYKCRRALESLFAQSLLTRRVVVDPSRLGFIIVNLWFSISPQYAARAIKILSYLSKADRVGYIGEFEGEYRYRLDLYVRSFHEVDDFLGQLTKKFGPFFNARLFSCSLSIRDYALRLLAPALEQAPALTIGSTLENITVSEHEHRILQLLTLHSNTSQAEIARNIGIPATTLDYRIKKLRSQGIIVGYHVVPRVEKFHDAGLTMHLHRIRLFSTDTQVRSTIDRFAENEPSLWGITHTTGAFDLELCSASTSAEAERDFHQRVAQALGQFMAHHAAVRIIQHHKVNTYPF